LGSPRFRLGQRGNDQESSWRCCFEHRRASGGVSRERHDRLAAGGAPRRGRGAHGVLAGLLDGAHRPRGALARRRGRSGVRIVRSTRFSSASRKIGQPPMSAASRPIMLRRGNGSHTRHHTAAAASATRATRARSRPCGPAYPSCSSLAGTAAVTSSRLGRSRSAPRRRRPDCVGPPRAHDRGCVLRSRRT
jgi:hypothetical protein